MAYAIVLLFVFVTLFSVAGKHLSTPVGRIDDRGDLIAIAIISLVWAIAGTFVFHYYMG